MIGILFIITLISLFFLVVRASLLTQRYEILLSEKYPEIKEELTTRKKLGFNAVPLFEAIKSFNKAIRLGDEELRAMAVKCRNTDLFFAFCVILLFILTLLRIGLRT